MVHSNLERWFELKNGKKPVPLKENYSNLQERQAFQLASVVAEHLDWQRQEEDDIFGPPTPPPSAPSSQTEPQSEASASQETSAVSRGADRGTLSRLLDMERREAEQARRARAAAAKKAALPTTRPIPAPRHCSQPSSSRTRQSEVRSCSAQASTHPLPYTQAKLLPQLTCQDQTSDAPYQQDVGCSSVPGKGTHGGVSVTAFDMVYQLILQVINTHVKDFTSEVQMLREGHDRLVRFVKDNFGIQEQEFTKLWERHEGRLRRKDPPSQRQQKRKEVPRPCDSVIPSIEDSQIKREAESDNESDSNEGEPEAEGEVGEGKQGDQEERTAQMTPPPPLGVKVEVGSSSAGQKRKADDGGPEEQPAVKRPAWVQAVSPIPNPHLKNQAKQLITVRKSYMEGGSRNPVLLE